jgi:glycosyltransferase involved in cell wall biosynthesis
VEAVVLSKLDTLIILSGDWSDDIFADTMTAQQSRHGFKIIQVIYDMLPYTQPCYFVPGMTQQFSTYMYKIFAICDSILAISKATKNDILLFQKANKLPLSPVEVFRLGDDFAAYQPVQPELDVKTGQFILCVGTVEARKNHMLLYYAVKEAIRIGAEIPPIVILGKRGWLVDNFFYLVENDPNMKDKLIFLHNATDQELAWLFENCQLSVYASFFEGWGLPIAESLARGKYCLASSASSMPEVAGDLIEYFSPSDPAGLLKLLVKYNDKPELLKAKEQHIQTRYHPTKWDDTYKNVERFVLSR